MKPPTLGEPSVFDTAGAKAGKPWLFGELNWKLGLATFVFGDSETTNELEDSLETTEVALLELLPLPNSGASLLPLELGCKPTGDDGGAGVLRVVLLTMTVSLDEFAGANGKLNTGDGVKVN